MTAPAVRILVVDDEAPIRRLLRVGLSTEGYVVIEVADAGEANAELARQKPDVVILDLGLPGMDGIEGLSRIKEAAPESEVVVMTGYSALQTRASRWQR